ncbi:exostosin family protein, partial [Genlisea aurea]
ADDACAGKYIFVHDIPARYNRDYVRDCGSLLKWLDMCEYLSNRGLGRPVDDPDALLVGGGGPPAWFRTDQFALEVIFHNRMERYKCLTKDPSEAAAFYVPYYAGLDASRYLWNFTGDVSTARDADVVGAFEWLRGRPEWNFTGTKDHFMVAGRTTWDFRRGEGGIGWGSKLMMMPEARNVMFLTLESSPWDDSRDLAIPYPTFFHPSNDAQVRQWQDRVRKNRRTFLFSFVGAPRNGSIRGEITDQCIASSTSRRRGCRLMQCVEEICLNPLEVMKVHMESVFCLQPPGDTPTRRSAFDSIVAGCIPVFFDTAYLQYRWHLPRDADSYSVIIPKERRVKIESVLREISEERVSAMREAVIGLIPKVIYVHPNAELHTTEDAFDLAIRGVIESIE